MWGSSSSSSATSATSPSSISSTESSVKFPDFFPATVKACEKPSNTLFDCLSRKSNEYIAQYPPAHKLAVAEDTDVNDAASKPYVPPVKTIKDTEAGDLVAKTCLNELNQYSACMSKYYANKNKSNPNALVYKPFRVQDEYRVGGSKSNVATNK